MDSASVSILSHQWSSFSLCSLPVYQEKFLGFFKGKIETESNILQFEERAYVITVFMKISTPYNTFEEFDY